MGEKYKVESFKSVKQLEDYLNEKHIDRRQIVDIAMNHNMIILVYIELEYDDYD